MSSSATNGWSVNNVMRAFGVNTKTAVYNSWQAGKAPPQTSTTFDIARVQDGIDFLTANGFCSYNSGTGVITPTHTDADGKPAHLRRKSSDPDNALELLPNDGTKPTDGT